MLAFAHVAQIALEEEIEERPDNRDRGDPAYGIPIGGDGCLDDIGGKLERQAGDQPVGIA